MLVPMISAVSTSYSSPAFTPAKALEDKSSVVSSAKLSEEEQAAVKQLKKTDQEVRAHERAHKNAGGQYAGSASYGYQTGPDGRRYAVSGEVPIDVAPVEGNPQATIDKLNVVISAALAPAHPSGQDRKVAAQATAARNDARAELATVKKEEREEQVETTASAGSTENIPAITAYIEGAGLGASHVPAGISLNLFS